MNSYKTMANEYILCAAIHFNDGKEYEQQPKNITEGFVVTGRRHCNCYATLSAIGKAIGLEERALRAFERIDRDQQGFLTNLNRYVSRAEAWKIAEVSGQIVNGYTLCKGDDAILISENLY